LNSQINTLMCQNAHLCSHPHKLIPFYLKGLVHPKMKIMSLMSHPHIVPSP